MALAGWWRMRPAQLLAHVPPSSFSFLFAFLPF
jgi:hypothetical protein